MSHRRVMIAANVVRAALLGLIPLAHALEILSIHWLMWVALGVGVCRVFFDVAYMSIVPSLVPKSQLTQANSRLTATLEVANIAGPSAGGFLARIVAAPLLPLASVLGFLSSAFAIWRIPEPAVTRSAAPRHLRREIREGVDFVRHHPLIRPVVLAAMTSNLFGTMAFTMFPVLGFGSFLMLVGIVAFNITQVSLRQRVCPPRLLGRMNATIRFAIWGVMPISSLLSGVIAGAIGLAATFWIAAVGELLAAGFVLFSPLWGLKTLDDYDEASTPLGIAEVPPPVL